VLPWVLMLTLLFNLAASTQTFPKRQGAAAAKALDIVERYIAAIGGRTNWSRLSSKITRGTIQLPEARTSGTIEIYEHSPNRLLVKALKCASSASLPNICLWIHPSFGAAHGWRKTWGWMATMLLSSLTTSERASILTCTTFPRTGSDTSCRKLARCRLV
jgi:hypothetical protein